MVERGQRGRSTIHNERTIVPTSPLFSDPSIPIQERLIVALDVATYAEAERLVRTLAPAVSWFKVGSELFTSAGPAAIALIHTYGRRVFLDLKYHDIPHTVAGAVGAAATLGVGMLNVHLAGGVEMLAAAVDALAHARYRGARPLLLGVTVLTSEEPDPESGTIVAAAQLAQQCSLDGVVASAREAAAIKATCGRNFLVVTPGIRPHGYERGDQRRIATPEQALQAGADYLVLGRPVTRAADPRGIVDKVVAMIKASGADSYDA